MDRQAIATELLVIARELTGATKDLAEVMAVLPELREKQEEFARRQEEELREMNRLRAEASRDLETKTIELLKAIQKELEDYFKKNGMGVRRSDVSGGLLEVFLGSDDGVDRYQSKVSVHIALYHKPERASFMLRNEELDDQQGTLAPKGTIQKLMQVVKKQDKAGFWAEGREL